MPFIEDLNIECQRSVKNLYCVSLKGIVSIRLGKSRDLQVYCFPCKNQFSINGDLVI